MGVSGCGKSTLGAALADALHWRFVEGDALHPAENVAKMASGVPLSDADRWPFLERVARVMNERTENGTVVACSALRRSYRDFIRSRTGAVMFVLPVLDRAVLEARLLSRQDHYMPASLLKSQLEVLEPPAADEQALLVDGNAPTAIQVREAVAAVQAQLPALGIKAKT